ncbi:TetR/AcrR family transcriptional regulator [Denitromonas ohlonensis]|uniref:TetR/AcrR family transcriptional regulator n=2 Tax=Denitromonas TaxID=139331 RepID=A0A557SE67_9RHOO|nr:TetR/AcrR family transcriptional regulator [Denitromonas ohlonensis]TVO75729.1 TetR/AcrR family transcriptional regulator [Denitromonas ohlonensis]TVT47055.1 MAG: TetR/AcrR family transcriptional regulator [Denitromonas halophila]TVT65271.1 MAG: TetR/AcrR family transcriptional regulator [Denitromonas halophila]
MFFAHAWVSESDTGRGADAPNRRDGTEDWVLTDHVEKKAPVRRRKEARPQELTAAALSLFVEKGFSATRLDEVAARAGVSKGTLYLYFDSKEALFLAVIREGIVPIIEEGRKLLVAHADDPVRMLREYLFGWWALFGDTELGGVPKLMTSEAQNFPEVAQYYVREVIQPGKALMREVLDRGVAKGVFRQTNSELVTHILMAPLLHLALWRHSFAVCCQVPDMDPAAYLESFFDLVLKGLAVTPEGGK